MRTLNSLGELKVTGGRSTWSLMGQNDYGASYRVQNSNFQLANSTVSGSWNAIFLDGAPGLERFVLGGADSSASTGVGYMQPDRAGDSWRFNAGNIQFWNLTQSIWQTPFIRNIGGGPRLVIGTGNATTSYGLGCAIKTVTVNYVATILDCTILVDASLGDVTISLPASLSAFEKQFHVKKIDSSINTVTIDPDGAELIDGSATEVITTQWSDAHFVSNGTAWYLL